MLIIDMNVGLVRIRDEIILAHENYKSLFERSILTKDLTETRCSLANRQN